MSSQDVSRAIRRDQGAYSTYIQGVFVSSETVDANLSTVSVLGVPLRFIRKLEHVTLTAGDAVLILKGNGIPMTIIGVIKGNPTLAA